jgi:hypothetical protein
MERPELQNRAYFCEEWHVIFNVARTTSHEFAKRSVDCPATVATILATILRGSTRHRTELRKIKLVFDNRTRV